jgi:hypothetical protein
MSRLRLLIWSLISGVFFSLSFGGIGAYFVNRDSRLFSRTQYRNLRAPPSVIFGATALASEGNSKTVDKTLTVDVLSVPGVKRGGTLEQSTTPSAHASDLRLPQFSWGCFTTLSEGLAAPSYSEIGAQSGSSHVNAPRIAQRQPLG